MKKTVLVRGPLLTLSGYGTHTRQVFRWLENYKNIDLRAICLPWGITPWMINGDQENGLISRIMAKSEPLNMPADVSFQVQLPNEWDTSLAKYNVGISAFVETDKCNSAWIEHCNKMDHIVVPSCHIKDTVQRSGNLTTPISVVPEAFYDSMLEENAKSNLDLNLNTDFNFLIFGQLTGFNPWSDRKNTFFALKWLCEAFADDPNVGIVIKTNSGGNSNIDRGVTKNTIHQVLKEARPGPYPRVYLIHGRLEHDEMFSIYKNTKIKALVSATRGEGFGLPLLEASVSGLPVLATNWSGHKDFLSKGNFIKFDYNLQDIHESRIDNEIFIKGSKWAEVKEDDFKRKVKKFREKPNKPQEWAKDLSKSLKNSHSQDAISSNYHEVFGEIIL